MVERNSTQMYRMTSRPPAECTKWSLFSSMVDTFLTHFDIKMQVLIYYILLGLLLSGTNSFECKCNFDDDCFMFQNVRYINGKFHSDVWKRQEHEASGKEKDTGYPEKFNNMILISSKTTYMYIPMGINHRDVEAYLRSTTPLREDGIDRCLSFMFNTTGFPNSIIQVQIWPDERPTHMDILFFAPTYSQRYVSGYWQEAIVDIPGSTSGYLVFAGYQKTYSSQVFLDDVVILEGQCHKSRPYPEFPQHTTKRHYGWTTRKYGLTTRREPVTTPPLINLNDVFFKLAGPHFSNTFNDDQWQRTLLNLPPKLTLSTAMWTRRNVYPPELGIVVPYSVERGSFISLSVGLNYLSPPPYSKAYLMTAYQYTADGQDKCLKLDYIQHQVSGNLGSIGIYMSSYFLSSDMFTFNARMERLYKYPREGTYVYNSSPYWKNLEVTIPGSRTGHVFIRGVSGTGKGIIAVDNVSVFAGSCPNPNLL